LNHGMPKNARKLEAPFQAANVPRSKGFLDKTRRESGYSLIFLLLSLQDLLAALPCRMKICGRSRVTPGSEIAALTLPSELTRKSGRVPKSFAPG
jgi:hypothetical protein